MASDLDRPIIVVGAARSGTHLLAHIVSLHREVAYLAEPNYIWKFSNAWLGHDMIPAWRATPYVRSYIRGTFARFCREAGKTRFCEKTPANSIRLPFVMQVVPDAKVVHLIRDGRDVVASTRKKFYGDFAKIGRLTAADPDGTRGRWLDYKAFSLIVSRFMQRLRVGVPIRDFVFYLPFFFNTALNIAGLRSRYIWGIRLPGLKQLFRSHKDVEVAALQWRMSVESVLNYVANHPEKDYLEVRFEDLCANPIKIAKRIYQFCELDFTTEVEEGIRVEFSKTSKIDAAKLRMTREEEELVNDHIAHTLRSLGYAADRLAENAEEQSAQAPPLRDAMMTQSRLS
jgi:hypothetical protein